MKKCKFCAEEIQSDAIKCKHCGEWLNKKKEISFNSKKTKVHPKNGFAQRLIKVFKWLLILTLLAFIIAGFSDSIETGFYVISYFIGFWIIWIILKMIYRYLRYGKINPNKIEEKIDIKKHEDIINSWSKFYFVLAIINIGIYSFLAIYSGITYFFIFTIPGLILFLLAYYMFRAKSRKAAIIFLIYYLIILLFNLAISSVVGDGASAGSLLFIIGFIGIFKCVNSTNKLSKSKSYESNNTR